MSCDRRTSTQPSLPTGPASGLSPLVRRTAGDDEHPLRNFGGHDKGRRPEALAYCLHIRSRDARDQLVSRAVHAVLYQVFGDELSGLLRTVLAGEVVADRATAERLARSMGALVHLHGRHPVDARGRCAQCRSARRWWWPRPGRSTCSVHVALSRYLRQPRDVTLTARTEPDPHRRRGRRDDFRATARTRTVVPHRRSGSVRPSLRPRRSACGCGMRWGRGVVRVWRLLFVSWQPELVTTGRVRLRQLVCVCCGERTWVVVGPPRCASCTDTVVHDRTREPPAADS